MYKAKELREALSQHPYEDIINLIVKAYRLSPDVQREVDHLGEVHYIIGGMEPRQSF